MTLDELRAVDVPAAGGRLSPEQQAEIGEATIAATLAGLVSLTSVDPDRLEADRLERQADRIRTAAVFAAVPELAAR